MRRSKKRGLGNACASLTFKKWANIEPGIWARVALIDHGDDGQETVGEIQLLLDDEYARVRWIKVREKFQRCGAGTKLYEQALDFACKHYRPLASDTVRTEMSQGFWMKQVRKGRARCAQPTDKSSDGCRFYRMKSICPDNRSLAGRRKRRRK